MLKDKDKKGINLPQNTKQANTQTNKTNVYQSTSRYWLLIYSICGGKRNQQQQQNIWSKGLGWFLQAQTVDSLSVV